MKQRSPAFQFVMRLDSQADSQRLVDLKATISAYNKLGLTTYTTTPRPLRLRVCVKGRLGKNNPHASKYRNVGVVSIIKAHAQHFDVYVQSRYL